MARSLKVPFVFEVRDLWPQSLVGVGASSSESLLYRCLDRTARFLDRRATHIVATTHQQRRQIVEMGIASDRVSVVMNGVDDGFRPCPEKAQALRAELNCADKFVAIYAGTLGMAHGIDTILRVAKLLEHRPEIAFWLVGDGAEREAILRQIAELGLSNVRWIGRQPRTRMPEFLTAADACLVTLRREKVFETAVPSKIFEAMAMGKPVILGVEGEARAIIEQTQAGLAVTPDDAEAILGALLRLEADRVFARRLGENGILAVRNRFARSRQAEEYLAVLGRCISPSTGAADLCTMSSSG
jgi:glycosyltransferase involved in cell wall biosynthesis